jgi:anti-sigma B factor antagonist
MKLTLGTKELATVADYEDTQVAAFDVGISHDQGSILVSFSGELDIMTAETMRQVFLHPDVASASQVRVDLTQATFLDSSAIGLLVAACRRVRSTTGTFGVTCPDGNVRQVLEVYGLIEYLQVVPVAS